MTTSEPFRPWLHRFAVVLVGCTFGLLVVGATVTSMGAGLSVPDWPTTLGFNMFAVPFEQWVGRGGIFWEHGHRLAGSFVGVLCVVMTIWLWRTPLRWTGIVLLITVIVQGVMGGLRVTELSLTFAVLHGILGQLFLCLTVWIAAQTSRYWREAQVNEPLAMPRRASVTCQLSAALLVVLLVQLTLGALTRHMEAGLAIPDFPLSYGRIIPPLNQAGIIEATDALVGDENMPQSDYFTPAQVGVHFAHRVWALVVLAVTGILLWRLWVSTTSDWRISRADAPAGALVILLFLQVMLGMSVISSGRQAGIATAHQAVGAAILATTFVLCIRIYHCGRPGAKDGADQVASAEATHNKPSASGASV